MSEKDTQIGSLSLKVKSDTDSAVKGLDKLKETLNKLKSVSTGKNMGLNGLKELSSSLARLKNASSGIKLNSIASGISKIKESLSGVGKSVNGITRLTAAIEKLGVVSKSLAPVAGSVEDIKSAVKTSGNVANRKIESLVSKEPIKKPVINIAGAGGAGKMIDENKILKDTEEVTGKVESKWEKMWGRIKKIPSGIGDLGSKMKEIFSNNSLLSNISKPIRSFSANALKMPFNFIGRGFETLRDKISGAIQRIKSFGSSLARIAMYRAIRSILSEISKGFQEGISNAYEFSKISGSTLSGSLDRIATSMLYLKNSVGAMAAPLINAVAPAIDFVVQKFAGLVNFIGQAIASLTGQKTWLKAKVYATEYSSSAEKAARASKRAGDNAAKSAKKVADAVRNATIGIDELHIIEKERNEDNNGAKGAVNNAVGSGGSGPDFSQMFEEVPIENKISDMMTKLKSYFQNGDWKGLGKELGDKVNSVFDSTKFRNFGNRIGEVIQASVETANSFLDTVDFENVGKTLAQLFNGTMEKVKFTDVGKLIAKRLTSTIDTIIGFLRGLDWKLVGKTIGDTIRGFFDEIQKWIKNKDWAQLAHDLYNGIKDFFKGLDFSSLAKSFFKLLGTALGASVNFIGTFISDVIEDIKGYFLKFIKAENNGEDKFGGIEIIKGIYKGILEGIKGVGKWIKDNVLLPFVEGIMEAFGIHSPSTVMAEYGDMIVDGLYKGIKDSIDNGIKIVTGWATKVSGWFTGGDGKGNIFDKFKGFGEKIISKFNGAVSEKYTNVKDTLKKWSSSVVDWFKGVGSKTGDIFKQFTDVGSSVVGSFKGGVDTAFKGMGDFFNGISSNVSNWFKPVTDAFKDSGKNSVNGYAQGFSTQSDEFKTNLERYGPIYLKNFNKGIKVRSPSKLFMKSGEYTVEGYNIGIKNKMGSTALTIKKWLDSFKNIAPDLVFDLNGASLNYGMDDYLGQVDAQINGHTEVSASSFREGIETFYKDEIIPLINQIATDMRYQANKDEKTVVQIGGRTIEESVSRQRFANGYNFLS